jgi:hypothetical protein
MDALIGTDFGLKIRKKAGRNKMEYSDSVREGDVRTLPELWVNLHSITGAEYPEVADSSGRFEVRGLALEYQAVVGLSGHFALQRKSRSSS